MAHQQQTELQQLIELLPREEEEVIQVQLRIIIFRFFLYNNHCGLCSPSSKVLVEVVLSYISSACRLS